MTILELQSLRQRANRRKVARPFVKIRIMSTIRPAAMSSPKGLQINPVVFTRMIALRVALYLLALVLQTTFALGTSNHEYGPDEYVTIGNGISPDGRYAITAHGRGKLAYDNFHLYFMDASTGKSFGALEEIVETLDTGANAFSAKWSSDSKQVTIIYRVDRHAPLKAVTYRVGGRRAHRIKGPFDVTSEELVEYWQDHSSAPAASPKIFGRPVRRP